MTICIACRGYSGVSTAGKGRFSADIIGRLWALPLFAALDRVRFATLLEEATLCAAERQESLCRQGEPADRFYIILNGLVALHLVDETGQEGVLEVVKPGDTFGEEAVLDQGVFSFSARAIDPVRLIRIPAETFLQALAADFRFVTRVMASMSAHLHCLVKQVGELKLKSTEQRLASYLAGLVPETSGPARITLPYEKKVVASQLSMQPATLSRTLAKLRKIGVRVCNNVFVVEDVARLRIFCYRTDFSKCKDQVLLSQTPVTRIVNAGDVFSCVDYEELRRFDLFSSFTNDELRRLLRGTVYRTYRRGRVLFMQGDRAAWFFLILSGRVKLVQRAENGDEGIIEIFKAGQSFGEAAVLTMRPFPVGAETLTDSRLIQVASEPFLAELARVPALAFKVLANLARLHRRLIQQLGALRFKSPRQRLVSYLLTLTTLTEGQVIVRLPEDKNVIASQIGISAESLSRILIRLRANGVYCRGREVILENVLDLYTLCAQEHAITDVPCRAMEYCAARAQR